MCIFGWLNKGKNNKKDKPKVYANELTLGARPCDYLICSVMNKNVKCSLFSVDKDDLEELSKEEIDEINWLVSSGVINEDFVKDTLLVYINKKYRQKENFYQERTDISKEMSLGCISVSMGSLNNPGNKVAFTGTIKCDEGHGVSISFKDRKYLAIQGEVEFDYKDNEWVEFVE